MSYAPPEDPNPFEAPRAGIGERFTSFGGEVTDAELVRRAHIAHEASIRALGILQYISMVCGIILAVVYAVMALGVLTTNLGPGANGMSPEAISIFFWIACVLCLFGAALNGALGHGLRALQVWARWTVIVLDGLGLLYVAAISVVATMANPIAGVVVLVLGGLIPAYIFYLFVCAKGSMVFSAEYKEIIRETPHIKYRTSIIVKIFLVILVIVILLCVVGAVMNSMNR